MVQAYSALRFPNEDEANEGSGTAESSALLGGDRGTNVKRTSSRPDGPATIVSCVSNLCNTIIGSGMLTFPLAMASAGILPGVFTCAISGSLAAFGLYLLSLCATQTPYRKSSFFAVSQLTFPQAAVFFDAAIAIKCFGVSISYLIIIKSLMPNVVATLYHVAANQNGDPPEWIQSQRNWLLIFLIVLGPLSFLRRLDSLRHTSYIAMFSVVYLVLIVIVCYFNPLKGAPEKGEVHLIHFSPNFASTFPVQVFAFTCSQNIFPVYNELRSNTQKRMNLVIGSSIGTATLTYEIIAVFGYLTFGSNVGANIVAMYPPTTLFIAVGQLAIVILVMFSYPLQVFPCRNCLDKVFHAKEVVNHARHPDGGDAVEEDPDEGALHEMTRFKHTLLTVFILAAGFTIAYFVSDLQMVLSFVGSTGSTTISFILPGLFYWKLTQNDPTKKILRSASLLLALYGAIVMVFCLGFNVYKIIHPEAGGVSH